jgi:carboxyl-terminal processing protease
MNLIQKARLFIAIILIASMVMPYSVSAAGESNAATDLSEVLELLGRHHVSGTSEQELSSSAINGMLGLLNDPYTQYFSEAEWNSFEGSLNQNYVGIGVRLGEDEFGYYAAEVFPGSPAEKGGIVQGDYIIAVEGNTVDSKSESINELIDSITGPEGTKVHITVKRITKTIEIELVRARIQIPVVTSKWFDGGIGYVSLSGFSNGAEKPFTEAITNLENKGMKGLIVDLRGNPGGYLHTATEIAEQFIEKGILIHTKDRNSVDVPIYISNGETVDVPVILLVDENSASASEVVAGALQDYGLVTVLGTQTYGKGSVQSLLPLSSGGYLKVTIQEYLTPKLNKVNHIGITPDIVVQGAAAQMITALHRLGLSDMEITANPRSTTINGIAVSGTLGFIQEEGKTYIYSRSLAAIIDANIQWNAKTKAVEIVKGSTKGTFMTSSKDIKFVAGSTFIELGAFQKVFNSIQGSVNGDQLEITVQQENAVK